MLVAPGESRVSSLIRLVHQPPQQRGLPIVAGYALASLHMVRPLLDAIIVGSVALAPRVVGWLASSEQTEQRAGYIADLFIFENVTSASPQRGDFASCEVPGRFPGQAPMATRSWALASRPTSPSSQLRLHQRRLSFHSLQLVASPRSTVPVGHYCLEQRGARVSVLQLAIASGPIAAHRAGRRLSSKYPISEKEQEPHALC